MLYAVCVFYCYSPVRHCYNLVSGIWPLLVDHQSLLLLLPPTALWLLSNCLCSFVYSPDILYHCCNHWMHCSVHWTGKVSYLYIKDIKICCEASRTTVKNLTDVSDYLAAAKGVGVDGIFLRPDVQSNIDKIGKMVDASTTTLEEKTDTNSVHIQRVLNAVRLALIIVAAVMPLLTFLGFLFSILGMQLLVNIFVTIGWILVTGTFILCGIFLIFLNVMGDTCIAMDHWVQYPMAHTALDVIIPCVDKATAQQT